MGIRYIRCPVKISQSSEELHSCRKRKGRSAAVLYPSLASFPFATARGPVAPQVLREVTSTLAYIMHPPITILTRAVSTSEMRIASHDFSASPCRCVNRDCQPPPPPSRLHHRTICPQQLASTTASSAESHLPSGKQTIVDWRRQEYDSWCIEITNFRRRHARPALVRDYLPRLACTRLRLA